MSCRDLILDLSRIYSRILEDLVGLMRIYLDLRVLGMRVLEDVRGLSWILVDLGLSRIIGF